MSEMDEEPTEVEEVHLGDLGIAAMIKNGVVENLISVYLDENGDSLFQLDDYAIVVLPEQHDVAIGMTYNLGGFHPPSSVAQG